MCLVYAGCSLDVVHVSSHCESVAFLVHRQGAGAVLLLLLWTRDGLLRGAQGEQLSRLARRPLPASALDLLSGAVQASVIHLRIYTLDYLYSSITAAPSADRHATMADEKNGGGGSGAY